MGRAGPGQDKTDEREGRAHSMTMKTLSAVGSSMTS
jgi:hypothetical protein